MRFNIQTMAVIALSQVVTAQEQSPTNLSSVPQLVQTIPSIADVPSPGFSSTSLVTGVPESTWSSPGDNPEPTITKAASSRRALTRITKPSTKASKHRVIDPFKKVSSEAIIPTSDPTTTAPSGLTTTVYVTASIINLIEIISICPTNGAVTTVTQQSATCQTYETCVTIPASLCNTFVSTQDNGIITTYTTAVETWTELLPTAVTSIIQTVTAGAETQPQATSNAGAQGVSPANGSSTQTPYVTAGASRLFASSFVICVSLLSFVLV